MRVYDLKRYLRDLTARYFGAASVAWVNETSVKQALPLVTLGFRNLTRHPFEILEGDEENTKSYPSSVTLEINIYSKGKKRGAGYSDDTLADMNEFLLFLDSPEIAEELFALGIAVEQTMPAQAVPALLGESKMEFRSTAELTVHFTQHVSGLYGVRSPSGEQVYQGGGIWAEVGEPEEWEPTAAGGGSPEMVAEDEYFIEDVKIEEEK